MIAGWCSACGSPAHVEYYGVLYCYECGKKAVAAAKRSGARGSATVSGTVRDNAADAGTVADKEGDKP